MKASFSVKVKKKQNDNLRVFVDGDGTSGELHRNSVNHHFNGADYRKVINQSAPHLDVKAFVGGTAMRGHQVVASGGQSVEMSIESLPLIVSPS